tara:strand:- start:1514 stop:2260 length:747 start_codon:yes stop_codon:yes gene_type:complete
VNDHFSADDSGFCNVGDKVSCSKTSASTYAEFFNVPIALFGALWFVVLIALSWYVLKRDDSILISMPAWNVLGILFVIYLIIAEILLRSLCPLCTIIHVIILITFILSIVLYGKRETKPARQELKKKLKPWLIGIIILNFIPLVLFNVMTFENVGDNDLTQCLKNNEVTLYTSELCSACQSQEALFGKDYKRLIIVECSPQVDGGNPQLCGEKRIKSMPTWIMEKGGEIVKKHAGLLTVEELKEFSDC